MNGRQVITAVGAGFATVLLIAVLVIELLAVEFSAIVGLPVGLLAGLFVFFAVLLRLDEVSAGLRRALRAYAGFGLAVVALLALRYVNVGRAVLSTEVVVGLAVLAAIAVPVLDWLIDRSDR